MPQMAPYNWLNLFILFNLILIFFSSFNYFINLPVITNYNFLNKSFYLWKW